MILKFTHYAQTYERFHQNAFDETLNKEFIAKVEDTRVGVGKVLSANVIAEGRAVEFEIEWPDDSPLKAFINNEPISFIASDKEHL